MCGLRNPDRTSAWGSDGFKRFWHGEGAARHRQPRRFVAAARVIVAEARAQVAVGHLRLRTEAAGLACNEPEPILCFIGFFGSCSEGNL